MPRRVAEGALGGAVMRPYPHRRLVAVLAAVFLLVGALAVTAHAAPSEERVEFWIDESEILECDGVTLDKVSVGWVTYEKEMRGPTNVGVRNFHITRTFTNPDVGDSWTVQDTGHVRLFLVDGELHVSVSGHSVTAPPDDDALNYGRWVMNLETGDYSVMGRNFGSLEEAACAALVPARDLALTPVQWTILLDDGGPGIHTIFTVAEVRPLTEDEVGDLSGKLVWTKKRTVDLCYISVRGFGDGYVHIGDGYQTTEGCDPDPTAMQDAFDNYGLPKHACVAVTVAGHTYEYCAPLNIIESPE